MSHGFNSPLETAAMYLAEACQARTEASLANMHEHYHEGVFAYSEATGERYSAHPGDYCMLSDDDVLKDENGDPMHLVEELSFMIDVADI